MLHVQVLVLVQVKWVQLHLHLHMRKLNTLGRNSGKVDRLIREPRSGSYRSFLITEEESVLVWVSSKQRKERRTVKCRHALWLLEDGRVTQISRMGLRYTYSQPTSPSCLFILLHLIYFTHFRSSALKPGQEHAHTRQMQISASRGEISLSQGGPWKCDQGGVWPGGCYACNACNAWIRELRRVPERNDNAHISSNQPLPRWRLTRQTISLFPEQVLLSFSSH